MEEIDVKVILRKLASKWYWFAISLGITLSLGVFYLTVTNKVYLVESSIQLKDLSLGDKDRTSKKFLSGLELMNSGSELEDEIGVLTSYATIFQSLQKLETGIAYFQYPNIAGTKGKLLAKEMYPAPFKIELDSTAWQLLYTPIHITFVGSGQFRLQLKANEETQYLYRPNSQEKTSKPYSFELDTLLPIGTPLTTSILSLTVSDIDPLALKSGKAYYIKLATVHDIAENYAKSLKFEQLSENSNIIKLNLKSRVPQRDIAFLKALCEVYIANDVKKKNFLGEKTIEFIDFQLQGVTDSLRRAEVTLEGFRAKNNIIDVERTSHTLSDQLFELEEKQAQLNVQNKYYQYMSDYLSRSDDVSDIVAPSSVGIQDPLLNSLLIQLSTLNEQKIGKDFSSSKQNPVVQVLDKKIQSTKQALIDNIANLIGSNQIALQESNRRVAELKKTIGRLPANERNLTDIKRRFTFNDNIYNYLLQKRAEAGIAIASNVPDKSVVDAARQIGTAPIAPNKLVILLAALFVGGALPLGLIFIGEFFVTKLESTDQLERWTDIPLIESIAKLKEKELLNSYTGESYLAHAFRYIRHHVEALQLRQELKIIGITSSKSGEGKTFCAMNLAISLAHAGHKTLLIDADLHHPSLAKRLNLSLKAGLGDYLNEGKTPVLQKTSYKGLSFLSAGAPLVNPSDLLTHPRMRDLLETFKTQYDAIILDTPPVGIVADYLLLSKLTDYSLLVVRQDFSKKDEVKRLSKLIKGHALKSGIIYNGATNKEEYNRYYKSISKKLSV
jgi:capsular exopolysaccharide synthesis family protein